MKTLPVAIAAILGIAGSRLLLLGDRLAITGGVLLLVAALAAAAVGIGGRPHGSAVEGPGDLSTRLGLGLLGGVLAGLLHGVLTGVAGQLGIPALLGAGVDTSLSAAEWWSRAAAGGAWGVALGALYPLPSGTYVRRGALLALIPAAWQLFYVYPFRLDLGIAGLEVGLGVAPLVVVSLVVCGIVAARVVAWGEAPRDEPLSAPLVADATPHGPPGA